MHALYYPTQLQMNDHTPPLTDAQFEAWAQTATNTELRHFFHTHSAKEAQIAARARALYEWKQKSIHCPRCGTILEEHDSLTARHCPACKELVFPRIDPCVIVLVFKGDEILLARHAQRNQNIYACIAGFIEAGESAEQAVAREIMEETGIRVKDIRYFGSQSWPFPQQLMLGYTAQWESGDIRIQPEEIADAQWFAINQCPATPPPGSLAYDLIEFAKHKSRH